MPQSYRLTVGQKVCMALVAGIFAWLTFFVVTLVINVAMRYSSELMRNLLGVYQPLSTDWQKPWFVAAAMGAVIAICLYELGVYWSKKACDRLCVLSSSPHYTV